jgi:hypothetical protein
MKRLIALLVVAAFTTVILLFFTYPEVLDKVWLWIIGFIGYIWLLLENGIKAISEVFKTKKEEASDLNNSTLFSPITEKVGVARIEKIEERLLQIEERLKEDKPFPTISHIKRDTT